MANVEQPSGECRGTRQHVASPLAFATCLFGIRHSRFPVLPFPFPHFSYGVRVPPQLHTRPGAAMAFFPEVSKIRYEGPESTNALAFRHYNPDEIIEAKPMREQLRFAVAYWHTFRGT